MTKYTSEVKCIRRPFNRQCRPRILHEFGYCTLFGLLGLITRRTLIAGVAYIVAIEAVLANLNFVGRTLTVVYYVRTLIVRWLPFPETTLRRKLTEWDLDLDLEPSAQRCVLTLLSFGLVVTLVSALWFARREFRVKTPEGN